jgi:hypothetical protein
VQHGLVDLVHVVAGTEARQAHRVPAVRCLRAVMPRRRGHKE